MGCCLSRESGPNAPYPGDSAPSASARAINAPAANHPGHQPGGAGDHDSLASPASSNAPHRHHHHPRRHHHQDPAQLAQHIDKPLRRHLWTSRNRIWTREALARERADFFDTRVTGRVEIWQTVRTALEILWESAAQASAPTRTPAPIAGPGPGAGAVSPATPTATAGAPPSTTSPQAPSQVQPGGPSPQHPQHPQHLQHLQQHQPRQPPQQDEALAMAQSILSAADITLPTGNLAQGVYDAFGNYYPLPEWIVADPTNVVDAADLPRRPPGGAASSNDNNNDGDDEDEDLVGGSCLGDSKRGNVYVASSEGGDDGDELDEAAERRREEKGKGVAVKEECIKIRCRLSDPAGDVIVSVGKNETVRSISRRIVEEARLPPTTRIRLAYLGKVLREPASLTSQGWREGHVLNAFVFDAR